MSNLINVALDLDTQNGKNILAAINATINGGAKNIEVKGAEVVKAAPKMAVVEEAQEDAPAAPAKATPAPRPAAAAPRPAAAAPAPRPAAAAAPAKAVAPKPAPKPAAPKPVEVAFEDLDEADQLEALKAHATKHTKKGKTADIKALVANYGADRVSALDPEYYIEFNEVLQRYSDGESVEDIFPNVE